MRHPLLDGDRAVITISEFAEMVGVGRTSAYEAARRGEIPARRVGHRFVVPIPLLLRWLGETDPDEGSRLEIEVTGSNVTPLRQAGGDPTREDFR